MEAQADQETAKRGRQKTQECHQDTEICQGQTGEAQGNHQTPADQRDGRTGKAKAKGGRSNQDQVLLAQVQKEKLKEEAHKY